MDIAILRRLRGDGKGAYPIARCVWRAIANGGVVWAAAAVLALMLAACAAPSPVAPPVAATPPADECGPTAPHAQAVANLGSAPWNERRVARALDADGNVLEFFANPDGESWTILRTSPDGLSCVLTAGEGWEMSDPRGEGA